MKKKILLSLTLCLSLFSGEIESAASGMVGRSSLVGTGAQVGEGVQTEGYKNNGLICSQKQVNKITKKLDFVSYDGEVAVYQDLYTLKHTDGGGRSTVMVYIFPTSTFFEGKAFTDYGYSKVQISINFADETSNRKNEVFYSCGGKKVLESKGSSEFIPIDVNSIDHDILNDPINSGDGG